MKLHELYSFRQLDEINMGGKALRSASSKINANVGFEFEMIVPDTSNPDGDELSFDNDLEEDYSYDPYIKNFEQIYDFFNDGNHNHRRECGKMIDSLKEDFKDWISTDGMPEVWSSADGLDWIIEWVEENYELDDGESIEGVAEDIQKKASWRRTEYNDAWKSFTDEKTDEMIDDESMEKKFLHSKNLIVMSAIPNEFDDVYWPHYASPEMDGGDGSQNIEDIAEYFENELERTVNWGTSYKSVVRVHNEYTLEPDTSIEPNDMTSELGLELISPPLPLSDAFSDLEKVFAACKKQDIYTNSSTGLHINVSLPDWEFSSVDYVKLVLLLGDKYILEKFDRLANTYAKSSLDNITARIAGDPKKALTVLDTFTKNLSADASKLIHETSTDKYVSVNVRHGWIEFRSPGDDWLDKGIDEIKMTVMRFVVALSASVDPTLHQQEYMKKLYKFIAQYTDGSDAIDFYFNNKFGMSTADRKKTLYSIQDKRRNTSFFKSVQPKKLPR